MKQGIPICYHPSKVVILDDNLQFLESLKSRLESEELHSVSHFETFSSPQECLQFLNGNQRSPYSIFHRLVNEADEKEWQHRRLDVNIRDLHHEIYLPDRFARVSVIIVDYDMPGMNGLDFCRSLRDPYIKKILVTGLADEEIAIKAFHEGIIDRFVRKHKADELEMLKEIIPQMQTQYFIDQSELILATLRVTERFYVNPLFDSTFISVFQDFVKHQGIIEYYLTDVGGSFLLLQEDGADIGFFTNTEEDIDAMFEMHDLSSLPLDIFKGLKKKQIMLSYHFRDHKRLPDEAAIPYLCTAAHKIEGEGQNIYYWTTAAQRHDIDRDRIYSYSRFLKDFPIAK